MQQRGYWLAGILAGCLGFSTAAAAQQAPYYLVPKVGLMDADFSGFDEAVNIGIAAGYDLMRDTNGTLSVEGELTTTASDGKISGGGEWDAETLAAYAAYRTNGTGYVKAKAGVVDQDVKVGGSSQAVTADDTEFSFGAGVGWRATPESALELEYTVASDDLTFISLGYVIRF